MRGRDDHAKSVGTIVPLLWPLYSTNPCQQAAESPIWITVIHTSRACRARARKAAVGQRLTDGMSRLSRFLVVAAVLALIFPAAAARGLPRWSWPLTPVPSVTRAFDLPARPWLPGHRGVDLAAAFGQEVRSPTSGVIEFSGWVVDRRVLTLATDDGHKVSFEPLTDAADVGRRVAAGDVIARRDPEQLHGPCGSCLYWSVRDATGYLNPLLFVGAASPSALWPVPSKISAPGSQSPPPGEPVPRDQ